MPKHVRLAPFVALLVALGAIDARAQETGTFTWDNSTEFAFVTASGNASSTTVGLTATLDGASEVSTFKLEVGGIRASSSITERTATGTGQNDFVLTRTVRDEKSAESYFSRARFDRDLGEQSFFVFGGAGWERNTFAGFDNRFSFVAGIGDAFINDGRTLLKADIGGTYTIQRDVEPTPGKGEGFGGLRSNIEFRRGLTESTEFETIVVADENLADTEDLRIDWKASVSVSLTDGLGLKTSYRLLFDNQPALTNVPLLDTGGSPVGSNVRVPNEKFDNFLTISLVISL